MNHKGLIMGVLGAISIVGAIGIPMGDPKFFVNAIALEAVFVALVGVSAWKLRYSLVPSMIVAVIVIVGNTVSPKHIEIMQTLNPLGNAIVLILGGYILQVLLLIACVWAFKEHRRISKTA